MLPTSGFNTLGVVSPRRMKIAATASLVTTCVHVTLGASWSSCHPTCGYPRPVTCSLLVSPATKGIRNSEHASRIGQHGLGSRNTPYGCQSLNAEPSHRCVFHLHGEQDDGSRTHKHRIYLGDVRRLDLPSARRQHAACLMHQEEAVRTIASVASWVQKCELYSVVQLLAHRPFASSGSNHLTSKIRVNDHQWLQAQPCFRVGP